MYEITPSHISLSTSVSGHLYIISTCLVNYQPSRVKNTPEKKQASYVGNNQMPPSDPDPNSFSRQTNLPFHDQIIKAWTNPRVYAKHKHESISGTGREWRLDGLVRLMRLMRNFDPKTKRLNVLQMRLPDAQNCHPWKDRQRNEIVHAQRS